MSETTRVPSDLTTTRSEGENIWGDSSVNFCFRIDFGVGSGFEFRCWITRVSVAECTSARWRASLPVEVSAERVVVLGRVPYLQSKRRDVGVVAR
jgi:hypothetical protein